jgi:thiosulfate/3-mercaptopyruvate sulfurtransferase
MTSEILVSPIRLSELIQSDNCTVVDCRFDFSDPDKGRTGWLAGHVPGATYAHLDDDLASPIEAQTGRHPLPDAASFSQFLAAAGWSQGKLLVAYDGGSNAISVRLWWLMRYFGQSAAVLDGGLAAWVEAGLPLETGKPGLQRVSVEQLEPAMDMTRSGEDICRNLESGEWVVLDARAGERYSGEVETMDSRGGHIPGALNRPFGENLDGTGRFRAPEQLRAGFEALLGRGGAKNVVHSCGSGVTACHNLFAMELAGLGPTRLHPGSWSEWIRDPARPINTGEAP